MTIITRPMLAATVEDESMSKVGWPVMASPKIDGIRCLIHPELGPVTRTFKPIPNEYIRDWLERRLGGSNLDGELYAVNDDGTANFNQTQSAVMSRSGQPTFKYAVFDCFEDPSAPFEIRYKTAAHVARWYGTPNTVALTHIILHDEEELARYAEICLSQGYEGVVIRDRGGPYKSGRSTLNQGWMLKYKPWADAEGTIIGFEELMHNENEDIRDAFDLAKRSSHKDNLLPGGTLGALVLNTEWGVLRVGTGFDHATRKAIWERNQGFRPGDTMIPDKPLDERLAGDLGRVVVFKYQKHGMQDLPRFPVFKGFRED